MPRNLDQVRLAVVHFNPCRSRRIRETFSEWLPSLGGIAKAVRVYELVLDNDRPEIDGSTVIYGNRRDHWLWQKEALINVALRECPPDIRYFGWLDHDMVTVNPRWLVDAMAMIDRGTKAVQLFRTIKYLEADRRWKNDIPGRVSTGEEMRGNPGGLWLADRAFMDAIGGLQSCHIVGGGDQWFYFGLARYFGEKYLSRRAIMCESLQRELDAYVERMGRHSPSAGFVDATTYHLWHGNMGHRQYESREKILQRNAFDPAQDVRINADGILEWSSDKPDLHQEVRDYFHRRRDDDE
ncbi:hypothetical protein FYK55_03715 [Roseiconus nitratireducens]|uniref:Glycosyltransferase n=1 Tax=Roseiconus nitratireducens TaxID=2605748 RepID=A0A5M6DL08_9BACT|nr:hypothetical protein [Roseiconus nitratireducens]KAA5546025.1 hypothetical protein FYK55_03715 [Roseiconus nitratireducens]